jgi:hypothetical protein
MGGAFATTYSWVPFCAGGIGLVVAFVFAIVWAEVGGRRPPGRDDEGATADDRPPWEQPGAVRRDCEPHRGTMLLGLGRLSLWLVALSLLLGLMSVVLAVPLAVVVLVMASRDRAKMRAGTMDPAGESLARKGSRYGTAALVLCALVLLGVGCFVYAVVTASDDFWGSTAPESKTCAVGGIR